MRLLRESPAEFLAPLSRPPERVYIAKIAGDFGNAVMTGTAKGLLGLRLNQSIHDVAETISLTWGSDIVFDDGPFGSDNNNVGKQIGAYLDGSDKPVAAVVQPVMLTPFTVEVHKYVARIPFGKTCSYGEIAAYMGNPGAARAVGNACGKNAVLIAVPCHRVVASNGIGGFGGDIRLKRRLLAHEHVTIS